MPKAAKAATAAADAASSVRCPPRADGEEDPHGDDCDDLHGRLQTRERVRQLAREVLGAEARDDRRLVPAEVRHREEDGGAEALDLQRAPRLLRERVQEPVPREDGERDEHGCEHSGEDPETDEGLPPTASARHVEQRDRKQHGRVDLRRDSEPEHAEAEPFAAPGEGGESPDAEQGGP